MSKVSKTERPVARGRLSITLSKRGATIVADSGAAILAAVVVVVVLIVLR